MITKDNIRSTYNNETIILNHISIFLKTVTNIHTYLIVSEVDHVPDEHRPMLPGISQLGASGYHAHF